MWNKKGMLPIWIMIVGGIFLIALLLVGIRVIQLANIIDEDGDANIKELLFGSKIPMFGFADSINDKSGCIEAENNVRSHHPDAKCKCSVEERTTDFGSDVFTWKLRCGRWWIPN